jgi:hypothetical protein
LPLTTLLHLSQTFFGVVNHGLVAVEQSWLMAAVYMLAAIGLTLVAGPAFRLQDQPMAVVGTPVEA